MAQIVKLAAGVALVALAVGCSGSGTTTATLSGTFRIDAGSCTASTSPTAPPAGSYVAVIDAADNTQVKNPQSGCADQGYTLLRPGTDGGITTGRFQPDATPTFDAARNSRSARIIAPVTFQGLQLGMATNTEDEQSGGGGAPAFPAPAASVRGTTLSVDLRSLTITYGGTGGGSCASSHGVGCWNLGSRSATGTFDRKTGRYVISWFVGESFTPAGDSLMVHLEGTFVSS